MVLFPEILVFHQLSYIGLFGQREPITTLENQCSSKCFFQKPIQYSQGNNVLDVAASNVDGFLQIDICVSSTELNRLLWNKMSLSPP
jgi:hypothetical protein